MVFLLKSFHFGASELWLKCHFIFKSSGGGWGYWFKSFGYICNLL